MEPSVARIRITADDAGQSSSIDDAIENLLRMGILSSVAVFANFSGGLERIATWSPLPEVALGIHYCLSSGRPVLEPKVIPTLVGPDGFFKSPTQSATIMPISDAIEQYEAREVTKMTSEDLEQELRAQLRRFICVVGCAPTFATVHHDLDKSHKIAQVVDSLMPGTLCRQSRLANGTLSGYLFEFLPEDSTIHDGVQSILRLISKGTSVSRRSGGVVEIACHPGFLNHETDEFTVYRRGRFVEFWSWQDQHVKNVLLNGTRQKGIWVSSR